MKKIKILYTIPNFNTAGSGKVLYDLAKGLDKDKFEVLIACSNANGPFFKDVEALGLPIFVRPIIKPLRPYYSLLFRLIENIKFIKNNKIDIVHSWNWSSDWSEVLATRLSGATFIYTKKAMTWGNIHWKIKSYLANFIITINEEMCTFFKYKKAQKLIPLGIDTDYFNPNNFQITRDSQVFKIVTVANLVMVKSLETLIQSIAVLKNPAFQLEILGEKRIEILEEGSKYNYYEFLKNLVSDLKLDNQVHFLGKQTDVRPFLAGSDLYVIPSKKEGMPMALIEAMAMGIPVLGSNIAGINYVLNNFQNLLFEEGNYNQLSEKILQIYTSSLQVRLRIGNDLRKYCIENFTVQNFVIQNEAIYIQLVKKQ